MKKPFILQNSSIEFILVGPLGAKDGLIIKSANASIGFIGRANLIYNSHSLQKEESENYFFEDGIRFYWGELPSNKTQLRNRNLLFCWQDPKLTSKDIYLTYQLKDWNRDHKPHIEIQANSFIENSYSILFDFIAKHSSNQSEAVYEYLNSQILWHISPLLSIANTERKD